MAKLMTLGAGNMASALLFPMRNSLEGFYAFTPSVTKAAELAKTMGGKCIETFDRYPKDVDFLFLAFKPQQFDQASNELLEKAKIKESTVIVSMLAGTPLEVLKEKFNSDRVVRIMPNTPCTTGKGVILTLFGAGVNDEEKKELLFLLNTAGMTHDCESEDQFDAITAVTGSGPAYIFEYARQMASYLESIGVKETKDLVAQLFLGTSKLMTDSPLDFETLRNNVTSKKGVTYEALESFKADKWEELTHRGLQKNLMRSLELRENALKLRK